MEAQPTRLMSFMEHLAELRLRIVLSACGVVALGIAAYFFIGPLYKLLLAPLQQSCPGVELNFLSPTEPFFVNIKIAIYTGLALGAPWVLLQLWLFIAPGLTAAERRIARPVLLLTLLLFAAGVAFVYYVLLPVSLGYLLGVAQPGLAPMLTQERYFNFITGLCLGGGLLFELPALLGLLGVLRMVSSRWLMQRAAHALVVLMILAAVITPTGDAFTMLVLTLPLMALYIFGVGVVWVIERRHRLENRTGMV
jgi:sec-independent protein translocase protein TatC